MKTAIKLWFLFSLLTVVYGCPVSQLNPRNHALRSLGGVDPCLAKFGPRPRYCGTERSRRSLSDIALSTVPTAPANVDAHASEPVRALTPRDADEDLPYCDEEDDHKEHDNDGDNKEDDDEEDEEEDNQDNEGDDEEDEDEEDEDEDEDEDEEDCEDEDGGDQSGDGGGKVYA